MLNKTCYQSRAAGYFNGSIYISVYLLYYQRSYCQKIILISERSHTL
ncbi:hypothetical protein T01_5273 [Trichinella spiralis]|uniref:Uncharacterized protein n=1 Tax=Trichinella spiralis TaxID=6334 RepID=A0A0V1AK16_TRISP|nr:hypothetical protein T01_5273 [Trichinella spiralis]